MVTDAKRLALLNYVLPQVSPQRLPNFLGSGPAHYETAAWLNGNLSTILLQILMGGFRCKEQRGRHMPEKHVHHVAIGLVPSEQALVHNLRLRSEVCRPHGLHLKLSDSLLPRLRHPHIVTHSYTNGYVTPRK